MCREWKRWRRQEIAEGATGDEEVGESDAVGGLEGYGSY
jgi:hypothetical protein